MKTVLCFSGLDPSGGAGISADIEAIRAQNCHPLPIVTTLTTQNTHNVTNFECVSASRIEQQVLVLISDIPIHAVKIGMVGDIAIVKVIAKLLKEHLPAHIPVVIDPVLAAGGGQPLAHKNLLTALKNDLFALSTVLTPNWIEAQKLSNEESPYACAQTLFRDGCKNVLITGTHAPTESVVINELFMTNSASHQWTVPRLPYHYHGSGCTLASALSARLALGEPLVAATKTALDYTYRCLQHGYALSQGQHFPQRICEHN